MVQAWVEHMTLLMSYSFHELMQYNDLGYMVHFDSFNGTQLLPKDYNFLAINQLGPGTQRNVYMIRTKPCSELLGKRV